MNSYFNEYTKIRKIALRSPAEAYRSEERILSQWKELHYTSSVDFSCSQEEHKQLAGIYAAEGIKIEIIPGTDELSLDSIFVRDSMISTPRGLVLASMGKQQRKGEPKVAATFLKKHGHVILGSIEAPGHMEGGDVVWSDNTNCAVGLGYRTNAEGIRQLRELLGPEITVHVCVLPHQQGPEGVFHLMSILSPLDCDLALAYSPLMAIPFRQQLIEFGIRIIDVPDEEYLQMGCNVLTYAPKQCLMLDGLPQTRQLLEENGCRVKTYQGTEISRKGEGGPTCLSLPLLRTED